MNTLQAQYAELLALTQIYIHREYNPKESCFVNPALFPAYQKKMAPKPVPPSRPLTESRPITTPQPLPPTQQIIRPAPAPVPPPTPTQIASAPAAAPAEPTPKPTHKLISVEPLAAPQPYQIDSGWKELVRNVNPHYPFMEKIPDDAIARKSKNAWQAAQAITPVIILTFNHDEKQMALLKNLAKAITLQLAPARVLSGLKIEAEKKWDKLVELEGLRLVIACDYNFYLQPDLKKHYREDPKQGKHYLNQTSLLLLSDLNLYLQQPQLKPLLWQAVCNEFAAARLV